MRNILKISPATIIECQKALLNNKVIAIPTETIYGIAARGDKLESAQKLFSIKKRELNKPIAILLGNVEEIKKYCIIEGDEVDKIIHDLLPGSVTVVLKTKTDCFKVLNPNTEKIGIRIPTHPFVLELAGKCDFPIALTSANISSQPSTLDIKEFEHLWDEFEVVVDGGRINRENALGSTVVDITQSKEFKILRKGEDYFKVIRVLKEENNWKEI